LEGLLGRDLKGGKHWLSFWQELALLLLLHRQSFLFCQQRSLKIIVVESLEIDTLEEWVLFEGDNAVCTQSLGWIFE
jgi:hypothetical protein